MSDRVQMPPAREITQESAEILHQSDDGRYVPFDDGWDQPNFEYASFQSIDGRVFRIPMRMMQQG